MSPQHALARTSAQRRELQTQIERSRRKLERNVGRLVDRSLLLGSWTNYVQEHPGRSVLTAAGVGMALAGVVSRIPLPHNLAERFSDLAMGVGWQKVMDEIHAALDRAKQSDTPVSPTNG